MEGRESPEMMREMIIEDNVKKAMIGMETMGESLGGNAGSTKEGKPRLRGAYNFYFVNNTGQILEFANPQNLSKQFREHVVSSEKIGKAALIVAYDFPEANDKNAWLNMQPPEAIAFRFETPERVSGEVKNVFDRTLQDINKQLTIMQEKTLKYIRDDQEKRNNYGKK